MPAGGHFAPAEEPMLFATDVLAALRTFQGNGLTERKEQEP